MKNIFYLLFLLSPLLSIGQGVSLLPTHFPNYVYDAWVNNENKIILVVTKEYIVIDNELYGYNNIIKDDTNLHITCIHNFNQEIKYINITKVDENHIILDEGYKISKLSKSSLKSSKIVPNSLVDDWYYENYKIELKKDNILFNRNLSKIDYVITSDEINYLIVLYNNSEYILLHNYINNGHYLNAHFSKPLVFKKASFYQKHRKTLLFFTLIFGLLFSYFLVQWKINISKKNEITKRLFVEMQLKSIRSQMNPHFLFNALSAIQNLINRGDNEKANHYLTEFAQLMRLTLDKSEKGLVPLNDEIISIEKYLEIEKLRFPFDYEILTHSDINTNEIEIPAMLVQPIVENAIIHGLHQKNGVKKLWIEFKIDDKNLMCTVTDNGVGINKTKGKVDLNRQKYGLKLAKDRIDLINKSYHTKGKINMIDLSENDSKKTGTQVVISMPLKY